MTQPKRLYPEELEKLANARKNRECKCPGVVIGPGRQCRACLFDTLLSHITALESEILLLKSQKAHLEGFKAGAMELKEKGFI